MKSFSQITRIELLKDFGVSIVQGVFLPHVEPVPVPSWLQHVIESRRGSLATMRTEKSISEAFIAPVLMAVEDKYKDLIRVFSGEPLITEELSGVCDFLITKDPMAFDPQGGYFVLVEAKRQDLLSGVPQCVAEMYAAQTLNENNDTVYGCVSIGVEWIFIKLEEKIATTDPTIFTITEVDKILGVFGWIVNG
jgi:hypothetical protein